MRTVLTKINFKTDDFGGVTVDPNGLDCEPAIFQRLLDQSLDTWRKDGFKLVWVEVPIRCVSLLPVLVAADFLYHHAETSYVLLVHKLVPNAYVPPNASHYIGVGGVVINQDRELLVVSERRYGGSHLPWYKLPGGTLEAGEHVVDGVIREVLEETGIDTRFESLISFRHLHGYRHGKSDIYFVCRLFPLSTEITIQEEEIAECVWMPVDKYLNSDDVWAFNKSIVNAAIYSPGIVQGRSINDRAPARFEWFMPKEVRYP